VPGDTVLINFIFWKETNVLGLDCFLIMAVSLFPVSLLPAYIGPGAGLELIPYSMGVLAWAGVAFGAVVLWPISALRRRLRKTRG
jgi:hypothetical protein